MRQTCPIAGVLFFLAANTALGQVAPKKTIEYVGQVIIVGNTITQDRVIRNQLPFYPGQILDHSELIAAEKNLVRLRLFRTDPAKKIGPSVTVLESKSPFKDILIKVEENTKRTIRYDATIDSTGRPIVRIILEDTNFDLYNFPTSLADFEEQTTFRGAGQRVRMELIRLNLFEFRLAFFADGQLFPIAVRAIFE